MKNPTCSNEMFIEAATRPGQLAMGLMHRGISKRLWGGKGAEETHITSQAAHYLKTVSNGEDTLPPGHMSIFYLASLHFK